MYRALESGKVKTTKAQSHAISAASNLNLQDVMMFFLTDESGVRRDIAQRFLVRTLQLILCPGMCRHTAYAFMVGTVFEYCHWPLMNASDPGVAFIEKLFEHHVPLRLQRNTRDRLLVLHQRNYTILFRDRQGRIEQVPVQMQSAESLKASSIVRMANSTITIVVPSTWLQASCTCCCVCESG